MLPTSGIANAKSVVRMETAFGDIDVLLYTSKAPKSVANFLGYVNDGRFDNTFVHRSVPGFIVQGGGYSLDQNGVSEVPEDPPVINEFDASRSNLRGTIAMAKLGGDPDSATSQWFFNLADNSANLDNQNGGFTVFGKVIAGMSAVDAIADLERLACASPFGELPVTGQVSSCAQVTDSDLVLLNNVREILKIEGRRADLETLAGNWMSLQLAKPARWSSLAARQNPAASTSPQNVNFSEGFWRLSLQRLAKRGATKIRVTLPSGFSPNTVFAFGPTPDNPVKHWYRFDYDGRTGAELIGGDQLVLHFVDGERGDHDLRANGRIRHLGAPGMDPDAKVLPLVSVRATDARAKEEGRNPGVFMLQRAGSIAHSLDVAYRLSGTATNGIDYQALQGNASFPVGVRRIKVRVKPKQDRRKEPLETVVLRLIESADYNLGVDAKAKVTIKSDE